MLTFEIDMKELGNKLELLSDWDEWDKIENEIFKIDDWPETSIDEIDNDLGRPSKLIDGQQWESTTNSYNISLKIFHLYEKTRNWVFAKLEPEAAEENKNHPEWYGKWCIYCKIWTRKYEKENCPNCGNELLLLPLNED